IDQLGFLWRGIDAENLFDLRAFVIGQRIKAGFVRQMHLGFALLCRPARQLAPLVAKDDLLCQRTSGQLNDADFARLEVCWSRVFSAGGLEGEIEERDEGLMDRPRGVLAVQTEGHDEQFALELCALKKQAGAPL